MLTIRIYKINPTQKTTYPSDASVNLLVVPSKQYQKPRDFLDGPPKNRSINLKQTPETWHEPSWLVQVLGSLWHAYDVYGIIPSYNWVVFPSPPPKNYRKCYQGQVEATTWSSQFPGHPVAVGDIVNHGSRRRVSPKSAERKKNRRRHREIDVGKTSNISFLKGLKKMSHIISSWWFQPPWNILIGLSPQLREKISNTWNHQPA